MSAESTGGDRSSTTGPFALDRWPQRVSIEREFKWSFGQQRAEALLAGRSAEQMLPALRLPAGFSRRVPFRHDQSTAYLDAEWQLLGREASLVVVLNRGPDGSRSYLKCKQTVAWHDLRRDAFEVVEEVAPQRVERAVSDEPVLPVRYLLRQFGGGLTLRPFATLEQVRWKMGLLSGGGVPLLVSWDECVITPVGSDVVETAHHVEVETNAMEPAACEDLAVVADEVTRLLGQEPDTLSKSRRAAALARSAPAPPGGGAGR